MLANIITDILTDADLGFPILLMVVLIAIFMTIVAYSTFYERKVAAWIQDRYGPNRAGPKGLLQPLADGGKFFLKEDFLPDHADAPLFILAPGLAFVVAMLGIAVIPWGGTLQWFGSEPIPVQVASIDIGLVYLLALGAMSVYGVTLGAWASNNKYSFYGAMRAAAQTLSYEVPLGLAILVAVLASGALRLEDIVANQVASTWNVFLHPIAFLLMFICALAETNRLPFDLVECEQELVGGFHTEYSSMKFALFFLGEYGHMIVSAGFMVALFFGGWQPIPWLGWLTESTAWWAVAMRIGVYFAKVVAFIFVFMWIRWTLPRFRFDQLLNLAWKGLVPMGLALVAWAGVLAYAGEEGLRAFGPRSYWAPIGEIVLLVAGMIVVKAVTRVPTGRQANLPPVAAAS
ncbi:MAG: NADH-quinone oxidoreductase subunit NuoH [Phycisphaerae bacterium]|nr:NADH-quinone oxidoreductase subunit NuoH [Phycisphaerae bacterium]